MNGSKYKSTLISHTAQVSDTEQVTRQVSLLQSMDHKLVRKSVYTFQCTYTYYSVACIKTFRIYTAYQITPSGCVSVGVGVGVGCRVTDSVGTLHNTCHLYTYHLNHMMIK